MTSKRGLGGTEVPRSPRRTQEDPQERSPRGSPLGAGPWPPGSPASRAHGPSARLSHQSHVSPAGPQPLPSPLLRLLLLSRHLRPSVREPSRGWYSVCPPRAGWSPAGAGARAAAPAGGGAGALRTHNAGSTSLVLRPEPAWRHPRCRHRRLCRWGRGRGRARSAAGPGPRPGLRPVGSGRACCSEPRVRRGAGAARVGTPRAPGPGPAAAACAVAGRPLPLPLRLPPGLRALPRLGEGARGVSLGGRRD